MKKSLPIWLRVVAVGVVLASGALSAYANYITVKAYRDSNSKKDTDDTAKTSTTTP